MASDKTIFVLLCFWLWRCSCLAVSEANEHSLVVGNGSSAMLKLSNGFPNPKLGTSMVCERVHIHGLSRIKDLKKFAYSVLVKVTASNSGLYFPKAEACLHRNSSLGIGMCPEKKWETISNGSWVRSMSPFGHKLLDLRAVGSSLYGFEVSIEQEFVLCRVIYFVTGIVMMSSASILSNSSVFYYGSSMASGVILVILVAFFQGMKYITKLLPTAPNTSLLIYSSIVGFLSFLLYNFHGFWRPFCTEVGIDEVFSYILGLVLLASVILDGAWLGFWAVRKFILTEDGSVDTKTAQFVAWSTRIFSALLILQSSVDPILAIGALVFGITVSSMFKRMFKLRIARHIYRNFSKLPNEKHRIPQAPDSFLSEDCLDDEYTLEAPKYFKPSNRPTNFAVSPSTLGYHGIRGSDSSQLYVSSFHTTPERRKFSKPEWDKFTRDSTERAVKELVSSPDFGKWVSKNADRITVTPPKGSTRTEQRRKWFLWF